MREIKPTREEVELLLEHKAFKAYQQDILDAFSLSMAEFMDPKDRDPSSVLVKKGHFIAMNLVQNVILETLLRTAELDHKQKETDNA